MRDHRKTVRILQWSLVILLLVLFPQLRADAQYFGRNKVQYETFHFKVLETDHFKIHFYPEEKTPTLDGARMAERWYARYSKLMNHEFTRKVPIIFYADAPDFQQTNAISGLISEGTGGVTEPIKDRVVLPFTGIYGENDHVIGHELVHAFQFDMAVNDTLGGLSGMQRLPLWMIEGMAEYLSLGSGDTHTAMWLRDALLHKDLPSIKDMATKPRYFPYRYGQALYAFIGGVWGDTTVINLFRTAMDVGPEAAIDSLLGIPSDSLSAIWHDAIKKTYLPQMKGKTPPSKVGKRILAKDRHAGRMNLGPVLSPDGKTVAFMSERDVFSIDLFLADAETGKIVRKLSTSERNFHFDAISFINTAGTWSPDGKQFAAVVYASGDNQIAIFDVKSGKLKGQFGFDKIGAISNPAWSPDGRYLLFSGMSGGISDLYLYDLRERSLQQLTDDIYAQLQPAWSPDGQRIAFVTDKGPGTDMEILSHGPLRIAIYDLNTGEIELLNLFDRGKHINPQFSPDGQSLFFISDQDGFSDIYRVDLSSGDIYRITQVATGISGLTKDSPALTVSPQTGRMLFSVFEHSDYNVYLLEKESTIGQWITRKAPRIRIAGVLPPVIANRDVDRYLLDFTTGLPSGDDFKEEPYRSHLQLDYIGGQSSIGISADPYGTLLGGGVQAFFSDMLGQRMLGVALQMNGSVKDIGAQLSYENREKRLNWGVAVAHVPYLSIYQQARPVIIELDGRRYVADEILTYWSRQYWEQLAVISQYAFSQTQRLEFNAGFSRIWFRNELEDIIALGDQILSRKTTKLPAPEGLNFFQGSAAFVGDNSYFGFTSPTRGARYRLEIDPTFGTLRYASLLADYRRYIFFRPYTFAFRFLHYGRYGKDAEDSRLSPLFLGYEALIRGYSAGSFSSVEYGTGGNDLGRLIGSRIAIMNIEFRVPLFGNENFGLINFPYLPTEVALFFDGGASWTRNEGVVLKFAQNTTERVPVFSTGVSTRMNILGYVILEVYAAYPFQRPQKGWVFGFQIAPGW